MKHIHDYEKLVRNQSFSKKNVFKKTIYNEFVSITFFRRQDAEAFV